MLFIIASINFGRLNKIRVKSKMSQNEKKGHGGKPRTHGSWGQGPRESILGQKSGPALADDGLDILKKKCLYQIHVAFLGKLLRFIQLLYIN